MLRNMPSPLMHKSNAYSYEEEVRILIDCIDHSISGLRNRLECGIEIKVNTLRLIKNIYVSPFADKWFYLLLQSILKEREMSELLLWSNMRVTPEHDQFGVPAHRRSREN